MSDEDIAKEFEKMNIKIVDYKEESLKEYDNLDELENAIKSRAEEIILPVAKKLGVFDKHRNDEIELELNFSKKSFSESMHHQKTRRKDFASFEKMLSCFREIIANAKVINIHDDKYNGTIRENKNIKNIYVFIGAYRDGEYIVPVEFNVKELPKENKLYMAVTMTKIKEVDIMAIPPNLIGREKANQLLDIKIAHMIKFVNSSEGWILTKKFKSPLPKNGKR